MKCEACADPRPDCMGAVVEGIGNRCAALELPVNKLARSIDRDGLSEGTASAQRINRAPMSWASRAACPYALCTYPEGQCAETCLERRP